MCKKIFWRDWKAAAERAAILKINTEDVKEEEYGKFNDFQIIESEKTKGEIFISPDIAICEECKKEMYDPKDRRYLHPFINCTCCGPRLTILDALPYDRERTSMKEFRCVRTVLRSMRIRRPDVMMHSRYAATIVARKCI